MTVIRPELFNHRSAIYREQSDAEFTEVSGAALAQTIGGKSAQGMGLVDLSVLPRFGIRGPGAEAVLTANSLPVPGPNSMQTTSEGLTVLRLGNTEFWLVALPGSAAIGKMDSLQSAMQGERCYPIYCQDSHAWFALAGDEIAEVMAKLCAVDLRPQSFAADQIVMSSVGRINSIVCNHQAEQPWFSIFSDSASAAYLWNVLLDAIDEFDGQACGQQLLI